MADINTKAAKAGGGLLRPALGIPTAFLREDGATVNGDSFPCKNEFRPMWEGKDGNNNSTKLGMPNTRKRGRAPKHTTGGL